MKIVVVGDSEPIGSMLVAELASNDHATTHATLASGVDPARGLGLVNALEGAQVVVDLCTPSSVEAGPAMEFLTSSTHNLLAAGRKAGINHFVTLSAVGTERLTESPYFRAKLAQEELIRDSSIPYTIVYASQFFEFIEELAAATTVNDAVRLPPVLIEPIALAEVVSALTEVASGAPADGVLEIAGPERLLLHQFVRHGLLAQGEPRPVVPDPGARYFGAKLHDRMLLARHGARHGELSFRNWIETTSAP